ncbi:MAG: iron-sulfur cluster assembly protein [Phycisphaerales bacterium]|jgi:metal-sulfur cluster biosynthetic enzyme|nr:iron-sulfur cluster assembly protein [Phycisphaerales bacterium]
MLTIETAVSQRLASLRDPKSKGDLMSAGLIADVEVDASVVRVELTPPQGDAFQHDALAAAIKREIGALEGVERVRVRWPKAETASCGCGQPVGTCEDHSVSLPVLDPNTARLQQAGIAEDSGFGEGGPEPLASPEMDLPDEHWTGWPAVPQWEIDPANPALNSGEAHVRIDAWDFEIWWQQHPDDLTYVAIQAMSDDPVTGGPERKHPIGRNVVVNLVYDIRRESVVAVYGTARDFRPFIEAFRIGCGIEPRSQETKA